MKDNNIKRVVIVYLIMIPVMMFLTEAIWGGLHGVFIGFQSRKLLQAPEVRDFMRQHGLKDSMSKEQVNTWMEKLSPKDQAEFQDILCRSTKEEDFINYKTASAACALIFGLVGLTSGALTKTWQFIGFLPLVSFLFNNPIIRYGAIKNIPVTQKIIIILVQFLAAYTFAFIGAYLCNIASKRKQLKIETRP